MADSKKVLEIIRAIGLKMEAEKEYLTELDQPIGDSDHGINRDHSENSGHDIGIHCGRRFRPPVWFGLYEGRHGPGRKGRDGYDDFLSMMDTAVQAVEQRGKATVEEATMLDAMVPSLKTMKDAAAEGKSVREALEAGVRAAWAGAEHTKDLVATKGRASYVGERGLGHQDPGATSYSYMLEVIAGLV